MRAYERTGGVRGAVARLAETAYEKLAGADRPTARNMLLRLAGAGEGEVAVRRRVPLGELDLERRASAGRVLDVLTQYRLVTVGGETVEVAHEALLREWPRLRDWLEHDAEARRLHRHITLAASEWQAAQRDPAELYRGARLASALDFAADHGEALNELERSFLAEARSVSERDAVRTRRLNRRLRVLLAAALVALVAACGAGIVALDRGSVARRAATVADAQRLGAQALTDERLDRALLLARAGVDLDDSVATRGNLLATLLRVRPGSLGVLPDVRDIEIYSVAVERTRRPPGDRRRVRRDPGLRSADAAQARRVPAAVRACAAARLLVRRRHVSRRGPRHVHQSHDARALRRTFASPADPRQASRSSGGERLRRRQPALHRQRPRPRCPGDSVPARAAGRAPGQRSERDRRAPRVPVPRHSARSSCLQRRPPCLRHQRTGRCDLRARQREPARHRPPPGGRRGAGAASGRPHARHRARERHGDAAPAGRLTTQAARRARRRRDREDALHTRRQQAPRRRRRWQADGVGRGLRSRQPAARRPRGIGRGAGRHPGRADGRDLRRGRPGQAVGHRRRQTIDAIDRAPAPRSKSTTSPRAASPSPRTTGRSR